MTIVEELDKMSGRPHRSKNIVDAMKYAFNIEKTPQNISEAIKGINGSGGDSFFGMHTVPVQINLTFPEGYPDAELMPIGDNETGMFIVYPFNDPKIDENYEQIELTAPLYRFASVTGNTTILFNAPISVYGGIVPSLIVSASYTDAQQESGKGTAVFSIDYETATYTGGVSYLSQIYYPLVTGEGTITANAEIYD